jgi:VanZ family protein
VNKTQIFRLIVSCLWLIILAVAMLTPGDKFPEVDGFAFQDKLIHFICFGLLSYLWCGVGVDQTISPKPKKKIFINYFIFGIFAGIFFEYLQQYIPFRSFDYMDMIVNEIGGLVGLIAYFNLPLKQFSLE